MTSDLLKVDIIMQDGKIVEQGIMSNQAIVGFPNRYAFFSERTIQLGGFDSSLYSIEPEQYAGKHIFLGTHELAIVSNALQCLLKDNREDSYAVCTD